MNKNWDEIRGKANREQNVPTKTFTHDGTQYALTGDHDRAHSHFHEARAHLGKMKRMNINNLPIITGERSYDDGTIATFKIVHGKEDIHITSPMAQLEIPPVEKPKGITEEIEQIVPVIRSVDNTHWVACMSGTFEPPYYHFPNSFEIPAEAFDDSIETDLDGQLISNGTSEYGGSIEPPELYFKAQTGQRDTGTTADQDYINLYEDLRYSATVDPSYATLSEEDYNHQTTLPGVWEFCYEIIDGVHAVYADSWSHDHTFSRDLEYNGELVPGLQKKYRSYVSRGGAWKAAGWNVENLDDPVPPLRLVVPPDGFQGAGYLAWDYLAPYYKGVSIEIDNVSNFASAYSLLTIDQLNSYSSPIECAWPSYQFPWDDVVTHKRNYSFQVNEKVFVFHSPPDFSDEISGGYLTFWIDPTGADDLHYDLYCPSNRLKYYGKEDPENAIGLMCGISREFPADYSGYTYLGFYYNYIGPNNDGQSTLFIPDITTEMQHIIPNVEGINDTVMFAGEIFLGLVKYEIEV